MIGVFVTLLDDSGKHNYHSFCAQRMLSTRNLYHVYELSEVCVNQPNIFINLVKMAEYTQLGHPQHRSDLIPQKWNTNKNANYHRWIIHPWVWVHQSLRISYW